MKKYLQILVIVGALLFSACSRPNENNLIEIKRVDSLSDNTIAYRVETRNLLSSQIDFGFFVNNTEVSVAYLSHNLSHNSFLIDGDKMSADFSVVCLGSFDVQTEFRVFIVTQRDKHASVKLDYLQELKNDRIVEFEPLANSLQTGDYFIPQFSVFYRPASFIGSIVNDDLVNYFDDDTTTIEFNLLLQYKKDGITDTYFQGFHMIYKWLCKAYNIAEENWEYRFSGLITDIETMLIKGTNGVGNSVIFKESANSRNELSNIDIINTSVADAYTEFNTNLFISLLSDIFNNYQLTFEVFRTYMESDASMYFIPTYTIKKNNVVVQSLTSYSDSVLVPFIKRG